MNLQAKIARNAHPGRHSGFSRVGQDSRMNSAEGAKIDLKKEKNEEEAEKGTPLFLRSPSKTRRSNRETSSDTVMNNVIRLGCRLFRWDMFVYECTTRRC